MNTSWLKIAGFAVVVLVIAVLVRNFSPTKTKTGTQPKTESKTFYDVAAQDDKRLRAEPQPEQPPPQQQEPQIQKPPERPTPQQPPTPQLKELSEAEKVEAEKLLEMALTHRKMARLPGMGYQQMVNYCRQIIEKFPGTVYAFKARRILADIPQRYRKQYDITDEEIKIDN